MELFIIDDDPIYRLLVIRSISKLDSSLVIHQCENGEIGLTKLEAMKNADHKIIVFLDINMPILDGWGFLKEIEQCNFYNLPQLLIYMVSSSTDQSDLLKTKSYGFVKGFFHKPLRSDDVRKVIGMD